MNSAFFIPLENRGVIAVTGSDAEAFLQGLLTNDVTKASGDAPVYACLLTPQGKYLYDFFVWRTENGFLLDAGREGVADILQKFRRYKLRSRIELEEQSASFHVVALLGDAPYEEGRVAVDPRFAGMGRRGIFPVAVNGLAGFAGGDMALYETHRIACGVPDGIRDIQSEEDFPMQFAFHRLHAIDFTKGCYVGQEVTTRTKHRGGIRKTVVQVKAETGLPAFGSPITAEGKAIGKLLSAVGNQGIAQVQAEFAAHQGAVCEGARVWISLPEWMEE